jgi:hypothetical protein
LSSVSSEPGTVGPCPVAPDALQGIVRQQTNPARWNGEGWDAFVAALRAVGVEVVESAATRGIFATDAGGTAYGMPHGVVVARSAAQVSALLKAAQVHRVPVTVRGGGLTTEGESVAYGGVLLDMTGMSRVLAIDAVALTVRYRGRHLLARPGRGTAPRRPRLPFRAAQHDLVGGRHPGCRRHRRQFGAPRLQRRPGARLQVVTPTGEIVECSDERERRAVPARDPRLWPVRRDHRGTLKIRPYTPLSMHYYYYSTLREAIEDLQMLDRNDASDYSGILTIMDCAVNLLVAFDSRRARSRLQGNWEQRCAATANSASPCAWHGHYALRPWRLGEALYLLKRKQAVFPEFRRPEFHRDGRMDDRTVVFSRAVWKHWGSRNMVIPDLATTAGHVCRGGRARQCGVPQVFPSLHAVLRRHQAARRNTAALRDVLRAARRRRLGLWLRVRADDRGRGVQPRPLPVLQERHLRHRRRSGRQLLPLRRHDEGLHPPRLRRCCWWTAMKHLEMKRVERPIRAMILNRDVIF